MMLADETASGGAHHAGIRDAFAGHQIAIGSTVMLAPTSGLAGPAPAVDAATGTARLPPPPSRSPDAHRRPRGRLTLAATASAAKPSPRPSIDGYIPREARSTPQGSCRAGPSSLCSSRQRRTSCRLGPPAHAHTTIDEVDHFVGTLPEHGAIVMPTAKRPGTRKTAAPYSSLLPTHILQSRGGKKISSAFAFRVARDLPTASRDPTGQRVVAMPGCALRRVNRRGDHPRLGKQANQAELHGPGRRLLTRRGPAVAAGRPGQCSRCARVVVSSGRGEHAELALLAEVAADGFGTPGSWRSEGGRAIPHFSQASSAEV